MNFLDRIAELRVRLMNSVLQGRFGGELLLLHIQRSQLKWFTW